MNELFLILHKVRGEPAFDIAQQMPCPLCAGHGHDLDGYCHECGGEKYWWIIPTSGHRAYPWWWVKLDDCMEWNNSDVVPVTACLPPMPLNAIDHYSCNPSPAEPREKIDLVKLGLVKPKEHIQRRI